MVHVHHLEGCAPTPLAHYLKALGVLRLVAEQADPDVRGWWDGDHFRLASKLTGDELETFLLCKYRPTPLISPWNKGAGFFAEVDRALSPIEQSCAERFAPFRSAVRTARSQLDAIAEADKRVREIKAETKKTNMSVAERQAIRASEGYKRRLRAAENEFTTLKADLIPNFRLRWRGAHREWMDAAMVLGDDGTPKYPAMLGTGGNDGRLDFTNNYMRRLGEVFELDGDKGGPRVASATWTSGALWGVPIHGNLKQPVGQYLPGTAGGANNANGPDSDSLVNPMDFILMLEGAVAFTSGASRRLGSSESSRAASPFAVNANGAAYASASTDDESARGEQWMPLWSRPSTYAELHHMLAEGRAQLGAKIAREPLDLARAVKRLGTARGIGAFQRYGYIERNGQSNLAVPLGRFTVSDQPADNLACIDDLDTWLRGVRREARDRNAPSRLANAEKRLTDALFAVSERSEDTGRWQGVLVRLAEVEETMAQGSGFSAQPIPPLRPEWVNASYDGSAEFRLAVSFALQARAFGRERRMPVDPIRRHWLPLDRKVPRRFATTGTGKARRLDRQPDLVAQGICGLDAAIALVERRVVEAAQRHGRYLPLQAAPRAATGNQDLASLLAGGVDLDRTLALAQALMAIDRNAWINDHVSVEAPHTQTWPDDAWMAVRLCALPWPLTHRGFELDIGTDPAMIRRLAAGDAAGAFDFASRRLRAAGVYCTVRTVVAQPATARLWAAALAFPVTGATARLLLHRLDPSKE